MALIDEIEIFQVETGAHDAFLLRRAGLEVSTLWRIRHGSKPRARTAHCLREAMASYRAEIAARIARAEKQGAKAGAA